MISTHLRAWHGDPAIKAGALATMAEHRAAETLVQHYGYWKDGRGCAVGCLIHSGNHAEYETRFGIPQMLARLEDVIFEGLAPTEALTWPERFLSSAQPGADLSLVGWQFLHWLITDPGVNPGIEHPLVAAAVRQCADILLPLTRGEPVEPAASAASAESAADAARAESAAESAESAARSAAWSAARSAAWSAARSAESAAESAESAAWSAARSAESAARSAAWSAMGDKLCELMAEAG